MRKGALGEYEEGRRGISSQIARSLSALPWENAKEHFLGYKKGEDGKPIIDVEQADIVKFIYD